MAQQQIRIAVVAAAVCVVGGVSAWLFVPGSPAAEPTAEIPVASEAGAKPVLGDGPAHVLPSHSPAAAPKQTPQERVQKDLRPAGERLQPGLAPDAGHPFEVRTRSGSEAKGVFYRAKATAAPLLVFMGEATDDGDAWKPMMRTLRASRDYHFVVVIAPTTRADRAARVEASREVDVLEAAVTWTQQRVAQPSSAGAPPAQTINGVGLIGGGRGAAAAVLLAAARRDVLAVVAISAPPRLGKFRLSDALPQLKQRHTHWLAGADDERSVGTLVAARGLPLAVVRTRPGAQQGARLLSSDRRAQTSVAGWLFSVMPLAQ